LLTRMPMTNTTKSPSIEAEKRPGWTVKRDMEDSCGVMGCDGTAEWRVKLSVDG